MVCIMYEVLSSMWDDVLLMTHTHTHASLTPAHSGDSLGARINTREHEMGASAAVAITNANANRTKR